MASYDDLRKSVGNTAYENLNQSGVIASTADEF